jgi:class 3 adenylate cyclase
VEPPEIQYARSGDVNVAYAVLGHGPVDLVFVIGSALSALEHTWEGPPARFYERLAEFSRLILLDKRGTGLSDRMQHLFDLETRMDDVRAVLDAVGSSRAALVGVSEGGPMTVLFAATYPERTAAAVLVGTGPYGRFGLTRAQWEAHVEHRENAWGTREYLDGFFDAIAPSLSGDPAVREWFVRWCRASASPAAAGAVARMNMEIDVVDVLPTLRVPTLVLHRRGDSSFALDGARFMADEIPDATLVELDGDDHAFFADSDQLADEIERFVEALQQRGEWDRVAEPDRVLATVLFTDIVGSTARLAEVGDARWRTMLDEHHRLVRRQLARFGGTEVDTAGDGFLATFDGPARAVRCARAIIDALRPLGLDVRTGLHTGEVELSDGAVRGIAVHIGARVAAAAGPGEVVVSSTVRDLVAGSGLAFADRGATELKGVPGEWRLYVLDD